MYASRFVSLLRSRTAGSSRRRILHGLIGAAVGLGSGRLPHDARAKKKNKKLKRNGAGCRKDGSHCTKESKTCKAAYCLTTPFTIEARWSNATSDYDTFLFVPNAAGASVPSPFINHQCNGDETDAGTLYPFAFVSRDARGPGDEVTLVLKLLRGAYEYWIRLDNPSPPNDLTVLLRNANGRVIRSWTNPENTSTSVQQGWHVFDIESESRGITSVDRLIEETLSEGAHDPSTLACVPLFP